MVAIVCVVVVAVNMMAVRRGRAERLGTVEEPLRFYLSLLVLIRNFCLLEN